MNLDRLTPSPWFAKGEGICCGVYQGTPDNQGVPIDLHDPTWADAEFIALARNAFDVMMRRGWGVVCSEDPAGGFYVVDRHGDNEVVLDASVAFWPDPFTALVEADAWFKANVEGKV